MSVVCKVQRCFVTRPILSQIGFDQISLERLAQQLMWHAIAMLGDLDMIVETDLARLHSAYS